MSREKIKIFSIIIISGAIALPSIVLAADGGLQTVIPFEGTASGIDLIEALRGVVNTLLTIVGIIAAIFVVIGGVRYIFSQGDEDAQVTARNTILYALIGLIVIILSGVLVNLVINAFR